MDQTKFDNLARLFGSTRSRRQVIKGLVAGGAGGALVATGLVRTMGQASAQTCMEDGEACVSGRDCCSENCDGTTGFCYTPEETICLVDGDACSQGRDCCSENCDGTTGYCYTPEEIICLVDGDACSQGRDCCSGNCDGTTGYCYTPDEAVCLVDGDACSQGRDCCSGNCDATTGYCYTPTANVMPATGAGTSDDGTGMSLIAPVAVLGAAAIVGARRLRTPSQNDTIA